MVLCDTFFKISYFDGLLGRHLEYWSYARFAKVANAGFLNHRPRRTFWYIVTNVVLRRPPTRISKRLFHSYLLLYILSWLAVILKIGFYLNLCDEPC